ncbi:MAG: hypothetical protein WCF57_01970 [Pyrinomonadaceae bacterium]
MMYESQVDVLFVRIEVGRGPDTAKDGALSLIYHPGEPLEVRALGALVGGSGGVSDAAAGLGKRQVGQSLKLGVIKKLELIPRHEPIFDPEMEGREILIHGLPHLVINGIPRQIAEVGQDSLRPAHFAELGRFQQAALLDLLVQYEGLHENDLYDRFEDEGIFAMSDAEFAAYREEILRSWGDTGRD